MAATRKLPAFHARLIPKYSRVSYLPTNEKTLLQKP